MPTAETVLLGRVIADGNAAVDDHGRDALREVAVRRRSAGRPADWATVETSDVANALRRAESPVLIDCLGNWVTAQIDRLGTWDQPLPEWQGAFDSHMQDLIEAWRACQGQAVAVTNEVGWGLV